MEGAATHALVCGIPTTRAKASKTFPFLNLSSEKVKKEGEGTEKAKQDGTPKGEDAKKARDVKGADTKKEGDATTTTSPTTTTTTTPTTTTTTTTASPGGGGVGVGGGY